MPQSKACLAWITDNTADGNQITFPLLRIDGSGPGPVLAVIAGNHGGEYAGVDAAVRLAGLFDPARLSGTVLIVPCAQLAGFQGRVMFVSPQDGGKLSQSFPGDPSGGYTSRLAHSIYRNLILPADAVIELRGGELVETMAHYISVQITQDEVANEHARAASRVFGARNIIHRPVRDTMGQVESAYTAAVFSGKLGILAEAGSNGLRDPVDTSFLTEGVLNVAAHMKMIDRPHPVKDSSEYRIISGFVDIQSPTDGLFEPTVRVDAQVAAGDLLGRIRGFDGMALAEIVSPEDGIVLGIVTAYGVTEGVTVIGIGRQE